MLGPFALERNYLKIDEIAKGSIENYVQQKCKRDPARRTDLTTSATFYTPDIINSIKSIQPTNHVTAASSSRPLVPPLVQSPATTSRDPRVERVQLAVRRFHVQKILHRPPPLPAHSRPAALRALPLQMIPVLVLAILPLARLAPHVLQRPRPSHRTGAGGRRVAPRSTPRVHHHHPGRDGDGRKLERRHGLGGWDRVPVQRRQVVVIAALARVGRAHPRRHVIVVGHVGRDPLGAHRVEGHGTVAERGSRVAAVHRGPGSRLFRVETGIHPRIQHSDVAHVATEFLLPECARIEVESGVNEPRLPGPSSCWCGYYLPLTVLHDLRSWWNAFQSILEEKREEDHFPRGTFMPMSPLVHFSFPSAAHTFFTSSSSSFFSSSSGKRETTSPPETNPVAGFVGILFSSFFHEEWGGEGEREVRGSWIADRRRLCSTEYSERVRTRRVLVERLRLSLRNDPLLLAGLKLHLPTTRLFYDSSLRIYVRENRRSSTTYVIILMRSCLRDNR